MKKLISIVILSLCFFALANEVNGGANQGKMAKQQHKSQEDDCEKRTMVPVEAFLCCTHPRLGAESPAIRLDKELLMKILDLTTVSLKITNENLSDLDGFLRGFEGYIVVGLYLFSTNITDEQLANILGRIGTNLRSLNLSYCGDLRNFSSIATCTNLQKLSISATKIDNAQLATILNKIGGSIINLDLRLCRNLRNFSSIANCTKLQKLDLTWTNITDEQLDEILSAIGGNLGILYLMFCKNLKDFVSIAKCTNLQELYLFITNITNDQLSEILMAIGGNLRKLNLSNCRNLNEEEVKRNLQQYPNISVYH